MRRDKFDPEDTIDDDQPDHTAPSGQVAAGSATSWMSDHEPDIQEQAGEVAQRAHERATAYERAMEQAEAGRQKAASGLRSAADQIRRRGMEAEGSRAQAIARAADTVDKSAQYLDEHEAREMWGTFETFVREHPFQAAAGALAAGVLIGRILR